MTRDEEIKLVAECAVTDEKYNEFKEGVIWGAKWADKNPKKGLISIDKACEWLESAIRPYAGYNNTVDIIESFRKAMEE